MKSVVKIIIMLGTIVLGACSTSPKTQVVQMGDNQYSAQQIHAELARLDQTEKEINKKKGLNATNTAAFLLWWPGLAYTYYDAGEAQKLIEQRRSHLTAIYNQKYANNTNNTFDAAEVAPKATPKAKKV